MVCRKLLRLMNLGSVYLLHKVTCPFLSVFNPNRSLDRYSTIRFKSDYRKMGFVSE